MNQQTTAGTIKTEITTIDLAIIAALIEECQQYDGLDFPVSVEEMQSQPEQKPALLLYYQHETLTGFAYLQYGPEIEIYGMVHPAHRRKGVGTALLEAAKKVRQQEGTGGLLLVCDSASPAGKAFAQAAGGQYSFSEHRMALDRASIQRPRVQAQQVEFRRAEVAEAPLVAHLVAQAFGDPEEEMASWVATDILADNQRFFIGSLQGEPIGSLRTVSFGEQIDIATFGVLPAYRGKGYGRQMLLAIVDLLLQERWPSIALDVETKNDNALGLYESCGFRTTRTYDYYKIDSQTTRMR